MKKMFKLFLNPISAQEAWLNKMSSLGYRLVGVSKWMYSFEKCNCNEYQYQVDYVGNENYKTLKDYQSFLEEIGIKYYSKSLSLGRYSFGLVKFRPWGNSGVKWATSNGMINRELLILEKKKDGKPFEIHSTLADKVNALKAVRRPVIYIEIFLALAAVYSFFINKPIFNYSLLSARDNSSLQNNILTIILGILIVYLGYKIIQLNLGIKELKERIITNE